MKVKAGYLIAIFAVFCMMGLLPMQAKAAGSTPNPVFSQDTYAVAKGGTVSTQIDGLKKVTEAYYISYETSDPSAVLVDEDGEITGVKKNKSAVITATIEFESGNVMTVTTTAVVTTPKFEKKQYSIAKGNTITLALTGTSPYSEMEDLDTSQNDYLKPASNGIPCTLNALKEGQNVKVTAVVDGLKVKCYVYVSDPQMADEFIAIAKGSNAELSISGLSEKYSDTPLIKTKKQSIVTVEEDGTISAKKIGSVDVSVEVDGAVFQVTVAVGKAKAVKAFNEAKKALGLPYSQEKRMESGYRDCSSFIWRAYKVVGQKMGVTGSWAPTAAAQAYYYDTNGKTIYTTAADASKLHGRYKNIGHVAMYVGNGYMIHASASAGKVTYGKYEYSKDRVVMIARPF
jgi:hypothetical protein